MVIPSTTLTSIKSNALDTFDIYPNIAIGDGTTPPTIGDTALGNELLRKTLDTTAVKDLGPGTYRFQMRVSLGELNGSTLEEIGIFDQATLGGDMGSRNLLQVSVNKTIDKEVIVIVQVTITASNV